jgi:hypothetical protein
MTKNKVKIANLPLDDEESESSDCDP